MAADMKLGDVMNKEQADLGISFCGSGGAGAITAQTKYGYKCRYGMRSIEEGVTAINEGAWYWASASWTRKSWARS